MAKWTPEQIIVFDRARRFSEQLLPGIRTECEEFTQTNPHGLVTYASLGSSMAYWINLVGNLPSDRAKKPHNRIETRGTLPLIWLNDEELSCLAAFAQQLGAKHKFGKVWCDYKSQKTIYDASGKSQPVEVCHQLKPDIKNDPRINPNRIKF